MSDPLGPLTDEDIRMLLEMAEGGCSLARDADKMCLLIMRVPRALRELQRLRREARCTE